MNCALSPTSFKLPDVPLPAKVLTLQVGEFKKPRDVTANVTAVKVLLNDEIGSPKEITVAPLFSEDIDDASHFTHDETVNEEELVGRLDSKGADTYEPLEKVRPSLGNKDEVEK